MTGRIEEEAAAKRERPFVSAGWEARCLWTLQRGLGLAALTIVAALPVWGRTSRLFREWLCQSWIEMPSLEALGYLPLYQAVNQVEALAWVLIGWIVWRRYAANPRSPLEPIYATAFVLFGMSDLVETLQYPLWLGWWKVMNLLLLVYCRSVLLRTVLTQARHF